MKTRVRVDTRRRSSKAGRWWLAALVLLGAFGAAAYFALRPKPAAPTIVDPGLVQSTVDQEGDSLQVVVRWSLPPRVSDTLPAESFRVNVRVDSMGSAPITRVRTHPLDRTQDTLYFPIPREGRAVNGLSCVAAQHRTTTLHELCTPWQYVRPMAEGPPHRKGLRGAPASEATRIVVRPSGLQVDPDVGGRCARWQQQHPKVSVWIEVNRVAIRECTGPNNRPTVAQFCAFAELSDGRRVTTTNSANVPYCEALFRTWERERFS